MDELKNVIGSISNRLYKAEEQVCELEDGIFEIMQSQENKEKNEKSEESHMNYGILSDSGREV